MMKDASTKIRVEGLSKVFGHDPKAAIAALERGGKKGHVLEETGQVVAVHDATFDIRQGEIFVVMGLSGSGKSTLVRMLNRLIEPTAGRVMLDGRDIMAMSKKELTALRRKDIAMVFQSFALMPHLTNLQNAAFGLDVAGLPRSEREERAYAALETVGLAPYAHSLPAELSGGMQQRVGLARALAVEPTVMLMDEAFSALDPLIRVEMQDELLRIQAERDLTVVFISHDHDEALRIGDRLAIMDDGRVVQTGTPQELISNPANDYIRSFFGTVDVTKVLTAGDLARLDPATTLRQPLEDLSAALQLLDRGDQRFGYVQGEEGTFEGVIDAGAARQALSKRMTNLGHALIEDPVTLDADTRIEECLGIVAGTPYPVPVVAQANRFCGTVSRTRILRAMDKEGDR